MNSDFWKILPKIPYFCTLSLESETHFLVIFVIVKVTRINYVSRNQLHSTANLNFGLMSKKAKHCCALSTIFSVQLIVFLDHVLLLDELAQKIKFLQNRCMAKWFYEKEAELQRIWINLLEQSHLIYYLSISEPLKMKFGSMLTLFAIRTS